MLYLSSRWAPMGARTRLATAFSGAVLAALLHSGPLAAQTTSAAGKFSADSPRVLLMPQRETTLVSQTISQVREITGGLGNSFKKGATLVRFDCGQPVARRDIARAAVGSAQQNLAAKERLKALKAAGGVEVEMARATLDKAKAELQLAQVQIGQCRIRAPYNGRIVRQYVRQYQGVKAGDPLLEIVATGALKLRLNVPSRWLKWLKPGVKFEIAIDETGKTYPASVSALNARVDAASQSIEIEGLVQGKHPELLAGMSGTARFERQ